MAQIYSITKTITLSASCTGNVSIGISKIYEKELAVWEVEKGFYEATGRDFTWSRPQPSYWYYYNFSYAGFDTKTVDFSELSSDAAIINVTLQKSGDSASGEKSYTLQDEGGQNIGGITATAIKDYLLTGSRIFKLQHGFKSAQKGPYESSRGSTMTASNTVTYTITVTYEASSVVINYGTKDGWKQCVPHYCSNGRYVPVQPYYGINGEWIKAGVPDD